MIKGLVLFLIGIAAPVSHADPLDHKALLDEVGAVVELKNSAETYKAASEACKAARVQDAKDFGRVLANVARIYKMKDTDFKSTDGKDSKSYVTKRTFFVGDDKIVCTFASDSRGPDYSRGNCKVTKSRPEKVLLTRTN